MSGWLVVRVGLDVAPPCVVALNVAPACGLVLDVAPLSEPTGPGGTR